MRSDECFRHTENGSELYVQETETNARRRRLPRAHLRRRLVNRQRDDPGADIDANQAPEIQTMYSVPFPVSVIRTRMRQEFERHRYVNKLPVVDVLIMQNNAEYQVSGPLPNWGGSWRHSWEASSVREYLYGGGIPDVAIPDTSGISWQFLSSSSANTRSFPRKP